VSNEPLLDVHGVAELMGDTVRHVRRLVFERRIPYIKVGALLRFDPVAIRAWLESQTVHPIDTNLDRSLATRRDRRGA
jgi:excisionase family DNA binding protein